MTAIHLLIVGFALGITMASPWASGAELVSGRATVIDGDTFEMRGQRIRLHGVDAPEAAQTCKRANGESWNCGQAAASALRNKIRTQTVSCQPTDIDQYQRTVAICSVDGEDLNAWLVSQGWASAYRQFSQLYVSQENAAKAAKRGIWIGEVTQPAQFRSQTNQANRVVAPPPRGNSCDIKGNISNRGERIYHVPGGQFYARTIVSTQRGERWFCSEQEARTAGWRKSQR